MKSMVQTFSNKRVSSGFSHDHSASDFWAVKFMSSSSVS